MLTAYLQQWSPELVITRHMLLQLYRPFASATIPGAAGKAQHDALQQWKVTASGARPHCESTLFCRLQRHCVWVSGEKRSVSVYVALSLSLSESRDKLSVFLSGFIKALHVPAANSSPCGSGAAHKNGRRCPERHAPSDYHPHCCQRCQRAVTKAGHGQKVRLEAVP